MSRVPVKMTINGRAVEALIEPRTLLIHFLREQAGLTAPISVATRATARLHG